MGPRTRSTAIALAATLTAIGVVAATGAAQDPPAPTTIDLVALDRESRFSTVDAPPRRRESAGDMFTVNARLRDASRSPAGRAHAMFVQTSGSEAQGSGTLVLRSGRITFAGVESSARSREFAITGGTGSYRGADGTVTISGSRRQTNFRVVLTP